MILRFPVYLQDGTPATSKVYALKITVDGTVVLNSADASGEAYPLAPVVTTNSLSVVMGEDAGNIKATITGLRVWESTSVTFEISKTGYQTYINTFKVFGYDLGNASGSLNPAFNIYLMENAYAASNDFANLIVYAQPFSKRVYYYNGSSASSIAVSATGFSSLGSNGFISTDEDVTFTFEQDTYSNTLDWSAVVWTPTSNLSVDCPDCLSTDCISLVDTVTARVDIDYTVLSTVYVDGVEQYPYKNQTIEYKLISYNGTVVDTKKFGFQIAPPQVYDPETYKWNTFTIPEVGDYVFQVCVSADEVLGEEISDGSTEIGQWYKITDVSGAADFTTIGAGANTVDLEFFSTGETPTWGTGSLQLITPAVKCCYSQSVTACDRYEVDKTACNVFSLKNNSFDDAIAVVRKMSTLGVLETTETIEIAERTSHELTLSDDGTYTITFTPDVEEDTAGEQVFIIHNYCGMQTCMLGLINSSICGCDVVDECDNFCRNFYFFNAISVLSLTYFGLINAEYQLNYVYTAIDSDKIAELYTTDTVLRKISDYCSCIHNSDNMTSSSGSGCGCS